MAYKQTASEGNFSSFQLKTPNEVPKIIEETNRRVRGLKENNAFEAKNREIFLRAQQYAQEVEQKNREDNFKLETENRQQFIDVEKRNMEALIKENEAAGTAQETNFKALTEFSKGALDAYTAIQEQRKQNRLNAAGELAQITGITQDRMASITRLDAGLTRSEFESLDFIQKLYDENTSDEVKQAYWKIYQNKGSREYIANKYITQNTALAGPAAWQREEYRLRQENPDITNEELIAELKSWESDYRVGAIKIGDKNLSPDFVAKNFSPTFQAFMRRQMAKYQGQRETEQKDEITRQRQIGYSTVFQSEGVAGLQRLISEARTKDRRQEIAQWAINSAGSQSAGSATTEDLQAFLGYPVQGMPGSPEFGRQFPEEAALLQTALRRIKNQERADTQAAETERIQGEEFKIQQKAAELFDDGLATEPELEQLQAMEQAVSFGYKSPVVEEFRKRSRFEKAKENITEDLTLLRAQGNLTTERVLELGLPAEQQTFWLSQAKAISDFRSGPTSQSFDKQVVAALKQHPEIKVSIDGRTNDSVLNMAAYYTQKKNAAFADLIAQGMNPVDAAPAATAQVMAKLNEDLQQEGFIKDGRYTMGDKLNEQRVNEAEALKRRTSEVLDYSLNRSTKSPEDIVAHLNQPNYRTYMLQMAAGNEVPQEVRVHAEKMKMTPYEWVNHIADALGVPKIQPPEELQTWAEYIENVEPEVKNLFTVNPDDKRLQRGRAIAEGTVTSAPVRANFQGQRSFTGALTYADNKQVYVDAGRAFEAAGFRVGEHSAFDNVDPVHAQDSYHNYDEAFDITHQTGDYDTSIEKTRRLKEVIRSLGLFAEIIGPGDGDPNHETHLHLGGLMRPITAEDIKLINSVN